MSDFDRFSLTIARWLTNVYDEDNPAKNYTTPGDVTALGSRVLACLRRSTYLA